MFKFSAILFCYFYFIFSVSLNVLALQVEPLIGMIEVNAGEEKAGFITLINEKSVPITVDLSLRNFALSGLPTDDKWFKLDCTSLLIKPKEKAQLGYKALIPENVIGEYSVRIVYSESPDVLDESLVSINTAVSVPFYALIKGNENYKYEILDFQLNSKAADRATISFENQGCAHIRPSGYCTIKKAGNGKELLSVRINDGNSPVYPGEKKQFEIKFDKVLTSGKYVAKLRTTKFKHSTDYDSKILEFEVP